MKRQQVPNFDEFKIPPAVEREFFSIAVELLGAGYTKEYYEQTVVSELRTAFRLGMHFGWREGNKNGLPRSGGSVPSGSRAVPRR